MTSVVAEDTGLSKGAKGDAVTKVQQRLLAWNPNALPKNGADGRYGNETVEWVKQFQATMGLDATGNVDATTEALLEGGLMKGAAGDAVTMFQQRLLAWNPEALPKDGADGRYGNETVEWVRNFQRDHGLAATGNIDAATAVSLRD
jgi:peptidoglycan hydrolase-like protein with peptidoglycan-binding domain